jgi:pimeloyl-ACP methyl ester carboxylesterase
MYILIHSPLVGPLTWSRVVEEMRARDLNVLVPTLEDSNSSRDPFWKQHADSVARAVSATEQNSPVSLVAHSGAGPLLPAIRRSIPNPIRAYVFMDAGIPRDNATRLELMKSEDPEWASQFQSHLEQGGRFPDWSFDDLHEVIPDEKLRRQMVSEIRPRGVSFFTEPIPVFAGWPDAPCVYIRFSAPYDKSAAQAMASDWLVYDLDAGHFHMLVNPVAVTDIIINSVNLVSPPNP